MQSVGSVNQSLFVNKHHENLSHKYAKVDSASDKAQSIQPIEGELLKMGDSVSASHANDLFNRSSAFKEFPYQVQHGLKSYTSLEMNETRESLKAIMGVDLYA